MEVSYINGLPALVALNSTDVAFVNEENITFFHFDPVNGWSTEDPDMVAAEQELEAFLNYKDLEEYDKCKTRT